MNELYIYVIEMHGCTNDVQIMSRSRFFLLSRVENTLYFIPSIAKIFVHIIVCHIIKELWFIKP
jgi:hypothetical protein